jgi:hypothetical protein
VALTPQTSDLATTSERARIVEKLEKAGDTVVPFKFPRLGKLYQPRSSTGHR